MGAWVTQSVECPTLAHVSGFEPRIRLCADIIELVLDSLSPSLSAYTPLTHSLKNKHWGKKLKKEKIVVKANKFGPNVPTSLSSPEYSQ